MSLKDGRVFNQIFDFDFKFDPPEARHEDGSLIPENCLDCAECHEHHKPSEMYGHCQMCTEEVDTLIASGDWCAVRPKEHTDLYMDKGLCLACKEGIQ